MKASSIYFIQYHSKESVFYKHPKKRIMFGTRITAANKRQARKKFRIKYGTVMSVTKVLRLTRYRPKA